MSVTIVGGGLAGSEAAWQAASAGRGGLLVPDGVLAVAWPE